MTKKRNSALRELGLNELSEKAVQLRAEMARERAINAAGTRPENPGKIRKTRRELARVLTIIGEKKRAPEKAKEKAAENPAQKARAKKAGAKKQ